MVPLQYRHPNIQCFVCINFPLYGTVPVPVPVPYKICSIFFQEMEEKLQCQRSSNKSIPGLRCQRNWYKRTLVFQNSHMEEERSDTMDIRHGLSIDRFRNEFLTQFERLPETQKASILIVCMFFFFCIHNLLQEAIMKSPGFKFGVMLGYFEVLG